MTNEEIKECLSQVLLYKKASLENPSFGEAGDNYWNKFADFFKDKNGGGGVYNWLRNSPYAKYIASALGGGALMGGLGGIFGGRAGMLRGGLSGLALGPAALAGVNYWMSPGKTPGAPVPPSPPDNFEYPPEGAEEAARKASEAMAMPPLVAPPMPPAPQQPPAGQQAAWARMYAKYKKDKEALRLPEPARI